MELGRTVDNRHFASTSEETATPPGGSIRVSLLSVRSGETRMLTELLAELRRPCEANTRRFVLSGSAVRLRCAPLSLEGARQDETLRRC